MKSSSAQSIILWFLILGIVLLEPSAACPLKQSKSSNKVKHSPIRLVLRTSKLRYRAGEPHEITAYLENVSDKPYFVGKEFFGFGIISSFHWMNVKVVDEKQKTVIDVYMSVTQLWEQGTTVTEKVAQEYIKLAPGMIHGLKSRGRWDLRPGRYRLSTTYREDEAIYWTEAELKSLPYPVWTQALVSNTVDIRIVP